MKIGLQRPFLSTDNERDVYYKSLVVKNTLQTTLACLNNNDPQKDTFQDIIFHDIPWASNSRTVIQKLGNPRYKLQKLNDLKDHLVLFFKMTLHDQPVVLQCHFVDNELYFVHIDFFTAAFDDIAFINEIIRKKYALQQDDSESLNFKDCYQNRLIIDHNVHYGINYICGQFAILKKLQNQLAQKEIKNQKAFLDRSAFFLQML
jgi:hypothetical protein